MMSSTNHPDQRFIQGILDNDFSILEEIYAQFTRPIIDFICRNNGTIEDANDIIQEGLTIIYLKAKDSDLHLNSKFLTYFFAICRNLWLKSLRKKRNYPVTSDTNLELIDDANIEETIVERQKHQLYIQKLQELSAECRQLLQYYIESNTMKKIAELMGYKTVGYARKRKMICKERLLNRIMQDPIYSELL